MKREVKESRAGEVLQQGMLHHMGIESASVQTFGLWHQNSNRSAVRFIIKVLDEE